jgi:GT2 family glycosyltransferase
MTRDPVMISLIIPVRNAEATIEKCLAAAFALDDARYEIIVVDDASEDASAALIGKYPCTLIRLDAHSGAARARNVGARHSNGDILFFTDADCLVAKDVLSRVRAALCGRDAEVVLGGTYTPIPYDRDFFSTFQSLFIHYSETKDSENPDYLATHAMAIRAETFRNIGGFSEDLVPILEDVEISHRLRRAGYRLRMDPGLQVQHIFRHSLLRSLGNAVRKATYWTRYSLRNRDLLADSGAASRELKVNGLVWLLTATVSLFVLVSGQVRFLLIVPLIEMLNVWVNLRLFTTFLKSKGVLFALAAMLYYTLLYPAAVWMGVLNALARHLAQRRTVNA